ncbi:F-box/WD repeat-containing protein 4 isoform X2 [Esox lucius]|uniref:F-box domain-containing protein n=1 Tax=Esox lucius TaxID=8010 RepID=A0A3P9A4G1_ESOLU|nr:F-box/WD repeat-containing protein 4 isoform X2 [Esox lucius]
MFLLQLPEDVLYHIMSYLDYRALSRLSQVCKTIYHFANRDAVWKKIAKEFINTGITRQGKDLYPHIPLKDRVKVSQNWYHGICRKEVMLKWRINLLPWIQLDGDVLYLSQAADIGVYHLRPDRGRLQRSPMALFSGHQEDVCRFAVTDTHLVSGGSDGKILVHHRRNGFSVEYSGHNQEVNCLDCRGGLIVSGSRDRTARIWTLSSNFPRCTIPMNDRVWSVAISPTQRCELLCCLGSEFRRGAGVLDIVYESPFHLFTCGYDTFIRSWDLRLSPRKCVMEWEEPHDSALYCIQTDGNHMIASGSSYYGVVRTWDKRQTRCLEMFQLSTAVSSPVYCLRFNTSHLYATLATTLHSLDFRQGPRPRRSHPLPQTAVGI